MALHLTGINGLCGTSAMFDGLARVVAGHTAHIRRAAMLTEARAWYAETMRCPVPAAWACPPDCRRCEWERAA